MYDPRRGSTSIHGVWCAGSPGGSRVEQSDHWPDGTVRCSRASAACPGVMAIKVPARPPGHARGGQYRAQLCSSRPLRAERGPRRTVRGGDRRTIARPSAPDRGPPLPPPPHGLGGDAHDGSMRILSPGTAEKPPLGTGQLYSRQQQRHRCQSLRPIRRTWPNEGTCLLSPAGDQLPFYALPVA